MGEEERLGLLPWPLLLVVESSAAVRETELCGGPIWLHVGARQSPVDSLRRVMASSLVAVSLGMFAHLGRGANSYLLHQAAENQDMII